MNRYVKLIPLGAVMALTAMSASAQTNAPAGTASAPATVGVTPKEVAEATQKAIPRSDTGTVVRTSPSPADKASDAMSDRRTGSTSTTTGTPNATGTGTAGMTSDRSTASPRRARADRN
jgi:hypothetical protein